MGGIVFLDEIGDADPKTQVQLLRFLDNGGFMRLGDNTERYSRVLLVAATNKTCRRRSLPGVSAKTSTTACPNSPSACRPSTSAARIFPTCRYTSSANSIAPTGAKRNRQKNRPP